jgi:hypothetical protein
MWPATFDAGDPHVRFDERDLETEHSCATAPDLDSTHAICIRALITGWKALKQTLRVCLGVRFKINKSKNKLF